jgi:hypothetical protein
MTLSVSRQIDSSIHQWFYSPLLGSGSFFNFVILYIVDITPCMGDRYVARPLPTHRTAQTQHKCTQISMPWVGFEQTIPEFERTKTVHALDRAATVIGIYSRMVGLTIIYWNWFKSERSWPTWRAIPAFISGNRGTLRNTLVRTVCIMVEIQTWQFPNANQCYHLSQIAW